MYELNLLNKINKLRRKMELLAACKGMFTHPEVVEISQKLDRLIFRYQQLKMVTYSSIKAKKQAFV